MDADIFPDIEQDNNPSFYNTSASDSAQLHESFVDFGSTALVNDSLGLSQKIKKMLSNPTLSIDVISTERLVNSSVIVYLIELRTDKSPDPIIVKRRYSEFKSLRDILVCLFPTTIIPPIPAKHTILTYLINSIDNTKELTIIDVRKRYFKKFLQDVVFDSSPALRNCPLVWKFLDPNYESCWENAVNEPPVSHLPQNLLLANPNDPTDQNGLYLLLPSVNGFDVHSNDNLPALSKLNEDLRKLRNEVKLYNLKESKAPELEDTASFFGDIPVELINFERNFHQNIKVLGDLHKLNSKNIRNLKSMIDVLIELGGNLNNFSLQIHELVTNDNNQLSVAIERFGSTMDSSFLNFEHFVHNHVIPEWEEPINQFSQYYYSALQLVKFYKYKLLQYKLLYKLKFNKVQELSNSTTVNGQSLKHLKDLNINSPSISSAIERVEKQQKKRGLQGKKSWYGLFGGNKTNFTLPDDGMPNSANSAGSTNTSTSTEDSAYPPVETNISANYQHRVQHIEKELHKLDQLIELFNDDMAKLTEGLQTNFEEYAQKMERKWLLTMLDFIRAGKQLSMESLGNWQELREFLRETAET